MSAERWLAIENLQGIALIQDAGSGEWLWKTVVVIDYDSERFLWTVADNGDFWALPRIRLYMVYEDPACYRARVSSALSRRKDAEIYLRNSFFSRILNVGEYYEMPRDMRKRIDEWSNGDARRIFENIYHMFHTRSSLNLYLKENQQLNMDVYSVRHEKASVLRDNCFRREHCFKESFAVLKRITLLCHPAVVYAMEMVHQECEMLRKLSLFSLHDSNTIVLTEFTAANEIQLKKTIRYLRNNWIERTTMHVYRNLFEAGRGWFDITVNDWTIYKFMKLYRFMEQVKHRMQTSLRDLVFLSTHNYFHRLCDSCEPCLLIEEDSYSWEENLIDSPFDSGKQTVFYLLLEMGDDAPFYSIDPDEFGPCLETLFNEAIVQTHDVHLIDPSLFGSLIFAPNLFLSSVGLIDPIIEDRRSNLILSYRKSILPLKAYAARYAEFKQLYFTNIGEYVEEVRLSKTTSQVKEEISFQIRMRESLERTLPLSIVIGPFWVNVKPLREVLIQKRVDLMFALLKMLTARLADKTSDILSDYNEIMEKMCQKPVSIEHIYEIREFMTTIPELLQRLEDRMKTVVYEYEILDFFRYALPDADFYQKWNALSFPLSITKQIGSVQEFHEAEVDKFRKQQVGDEAAFAGSIEDINVHISKYTTMYDVTKVTEVSIEVKKLWKTINELIQHGHTLNIRQELFEMPPIDMSNLFELQEGFVSYKNMWTYAAEYINVEESWRENPLSSLEVDGVNRTIEHYKASLEKLMEPFEDQPQIQEVISTFISRIESFEPNVAIIELLQHPILEPMHWVQFAKAAKIKTKLSLAINLGLFLEHNIEYNLDTLQRIITEAEEHKQELERIRLEEEEIQRKEEEYRRSRELRRLQRTEI
ncbi:dynein axonemal heavy chain 1 [Toxorhynchites rutilus septentrionalis]|uniref:dynein axonemal heavy chain 1 n=1 Tax=Toxorhynchites rutilus septentrionalis TaxID=329112 RepID=UPI002478D621|nr:dynein axonemal heavy chain 1 [Toxorhynchites rutilus septentrionalis]